MKVCNTEIQGHINNLSCIFDKFADKLSPSEKESLNVAMHLMDTLERNNGILILKSSGGTR